MYLSLFIIYLTITLVIIYYIISYIITLVIIYYIISYIIILLYICLYNILFKLLLHKPWIGNVYYCPNKNVTMIFASLEYRFFFFPGASVKRPSIHLHIYAVFLVRLVWVYLIVTIYLWKVSENKPLFWMLFFTLFFTYW